MTLMGRFTPAELAAIERLGAAIDERFASRGRVASVCAAFELRDRRRIAFYDDYPMSCLRILDAAAFEGDDAAILAAVEGRG